ncbi:sulfatase [Neobacillus niacini]|uniref:sulfatase family protein n=1 Tax=Neobacillus niacini TaxID=86668 RepID=UPI003001AD53
MEQHNIVYIHTHDSGKVFSPYGYLVDTPNIQELAKDSILFKNAFCTSPTCSPSRSSMLTGMYPHSNGMIGLGNRGFSIADYDWHIVNQLKRSNYQTTLCGIQHESGHFALPEEAAKIIGYDFNITSSNNVKQMKDKFIWDYENALNASNWIRTEAKEKPFFLSYGLYATHRPYPEINHDIVDPNYLTPPYPIPDTPETREDYARHVISLKNADTCIGIVINALKESNLYDNTIILFTTDHGIAVPFSKCNLYDPGIGVALMLRAPNSNVNGTVNDNLVSHIDVYPTLCELLNIERPSRLEGQSFAQYFSDSQSNPHRDYIFTEVNFHTSYEPARSVRTNRYKYIKYYENIDKYILRL